MLFVATCIDRPGSMDKRMENRPAHLAYLNSLGAQVKVGGALLGADCRTPIGSMIIFEAESEADIHALLAADPYSVTGLFESANVKPWRQGVGQSLA